MKDFKKFIKEAYLGNPLNEDRKATEYIKSISDPEERESERKRMFGDDELDEATDFNDPALIAARAAQMADEKEKARQAALDKKYGSNFMDKLDAELDLKAELEDLNQEREMIMIDMEEEAEPEGGPIADRYGERLNQIDQRIADIQEELDDLRMYESVNEEKDYSKMHNVELNATYKKKFGVKDTKGLTRDELIKKLKSVKEITTSPVSGTKAGVIYSLDNRKYVLTNDVKGARIGDYTNITLPKGTVIYNLPGGLMADHESLRQYAKLSGNIYFDKPTYAGIGIRRMPDILTAIENNSNVIEESLNEEFKVGDKVTYLGHPAVVTATKEYNGRDFVSVSYDKGHGATKARMILATSGDVKPVKEGTCGYTPDGEPRSKPASSDLNEMEDEIPAFMMRDGMYREVVDDSVNYNDFEKRIYGFVGPKFYKTLQSEHPGALKNFYDKFRVTNPNLEEEADTDVGGGAKQAIGLDIDDVHGGDAALDDEVEKMGYNESKKFDFKKMVKEALTPDYLK